MKKLSMKGKTEDILMMIIVVLIGVIVIYWIYNSMKKSANYEEFADCSNCDMKTQNCDKYKGCVNK